VLSQRIGIGPAELGIAIVPGTFRAVPSGGAWIGALRDNDEHIYCRTFLAADQRRRGDA
jgi:hypothetical protein